MIEQNNYSKPKVGIKSPTFLYLKMKKIVFYILLSCLLSCNQNKYAKSNMLRSEILDSLTKEINTENKIATQYTTNCEGAVNFNLRKPNYIILHHTAQDDFLFTIQLFTNTQTKVSAHYIVTRNGYIINMVNDYLRAWHAGDGAWGNNTDMNSNSIGIELDNNGFEYFTKSQIKSLLLLLKKLKTKYNIPKQNILAHSDICVERKNDPSALFPWKILSNKGFGLTANKMLQETPKNFNEKMALRIIGFKTTNYGHAVKAFKLHYMQNEIDTIVDVNTKKTIYDIYLQHEL